MQAWFALALLAMGLWGVWGFFAKLSSEYIGPKSGAAMQGLGVAVVALATLALLRFRPEGHAAGSVAGLLAGLALGLGIVAFVFALSSGGKASIVVPMTALYPVITIVLSVAILREQITPVHGAGVALALVAVVLLSR